MKTTNVLLAFILCSVTLSTVQAQNELPDSRVNVGVGAGMPYGGFGTKTILGYRNSEVG